MAFDTLLRFLLCGRASRPARFRTSRSCLTNPVDPCSCAPAEVRGGTGLETGAHKDKLQTTRT